MVTLLGEVHTKPNWRQYSLIKKKAARVKFFACRFAHAKPLMLDMNALSVYQINIYQNLILLYKAHTDTAPSIFCNKFSNVNHNYLTSSKNSGNYTILKSAMKLANFAIFKERSNPLEYIFRCNTKRNGIFTTIQSKSQRNASLTWQRAFVFLMILSLMFFY